MMHDLEEIKIAINNGSYSESKKYLINIIKKDSNNFEALYLLGICQESIADYSSSIKTYKKLLKQDNYPTVNNRLGKIYLKINKFKLAKKHLEQSLAINSKAPDIQNTLGVVLVYLQQESLAINYFKEALNLNNNFVDPIYNLLEIYEKSNDFENLKKLVLKNYKIFPKNKIILFYYADIIEKNGNLKKACNILNQISFDSENREWEVKKEYKLGDIYHKLNQYNKAFKAYEKANQITLKNINNSHFKNNIFIKELDRYLLNFPTKFNKINITKKFSFDLFFLVGFPRSGTTLLDTILSSHLSVKVIEEQPLIENVFKRLKTNVLKDISKDNVEQAHDLYLDELKKIINIKSVNQKVLIDKLPLNLVKIKIIHQLFPSAKFIFAIRHPFDCILSSFFQNFTLNTAMINFLDLDRTAYVYDRVMQIWKNCDDINKDKIHFIKYEDVTNDFDQTIKKLIIFLNLKWDKNIEFFYKTARKKKRIRTPSYRQVISPIYKSSNFKYLKYEMKLKNIKPLIDKWVKYFNY